MTREQLLYNIALVSFAKEAAIDPSILAQALGPVGLPGMVGALSGALGNPKARLRGALLGGGAGLATGAALSDEDTQLALADLAGRGAAAAHPHVEAMKKMLETNLGVNPNAAVDQSLDQQKLEALTAHAGQGGGGGMQGDFPKSLGRRMGGMA